MRRVAVLTTVVVLFVAVSAPAAQKVPVNFPDPDIGEDTLETQRQAQLRTAGTLGVFHDFRFADGLPETGITFVHQVVEDAAKTYKAAHYDHGNGMPVADVDGDGLLDLYFLSQIGGNQLWRNLGAGRFENITEIAGVGVQDRINVTGAFADFDNDGDADLFVTTVRGGNLLFENDGSGRFTDIAAEAGIDYSGHSSGATFLDYDGDGLLDLFVTNVGSYTHEETGPGGFYRGREDAFHGHLYPERFESSILYRNLGNRRFRDVSSEVGLVDESPWSGDASLVDFNMDSFPDLYVLNMQGSDHYYENNQGRGFAERTSALFPKTPWGAMGIGSFDFDNDGDLDLLLTDMHSDMNEQQVPAQEAEKQRFLEKYFYQERCCHILGNALYRNDGEGPFAEVSGEIGLENFWPWGLTVADVNADGWEDVFIASSMNYPFRYQVNTMRLNQRGGGFARVEFLLGIEPRRDGAIRKPWFDADCGGADAEHDRCAGRDDAISVMGTLGTRSSAIVDLDNDGDLDIVTAEFNSEPQVLLSDLSERRPIRWLAIRLQGAASNRDGLGARVILEAGGLRQMRLHDGKSGYLTQSSVPLYFGLDGAEQVDRIEIHWPSGTVQVLEGPIDANQILPVREDP